LPAGEFISKEVDPILEKISAQGIQSLTDRERQILEAARNKMAKR
jgi:predicted DNA binding protein